MPGALDQKLIYIQENNRNELNKVYDWIDGKQEEILEYLSELIRFRSVSVKTYDLKSPYGVPCEQALNKILRDGREKGFQVSNYHNRVGRISLEPDHHGQQSEAVRDRGIGIWSHLDVVPEMEGWLSDPYEAEIRDGYIFGRGVSDNKGAAAGVLYILQAFQELGLKIKHPVHLYLGTDEEQGMSDVADYLEFFDAPDFNLVPDAEFPGIAGEAGRLQFALSPQHSLSENFLRLEGGKLHNIIPDQAYAEIRKFSGLNWNKLKTLESIELHETKETIQITAHGQASHVAAAEQGINAIRILTQALCELEGITDTERQIFEKLTEINRTPYGDTLGIDGSDNESGRTVSAGTVITLKAGRPEIINDTRFCVTSHADDLIAEVQRWADSNDFILAVQEKKEPYVNRDEEYMSIVKQAYEDVTGVKTDKFPIIKGGTYAGKLPNAIATGFVDSRDYETPQGLPEGHGGPHQPNENMSVKHYIAGLKILATIIAYLVL